jgi:hypothetical protein
MAFKGNSKLVQILLNNRKQKLKKPSNSTQSVFSSWGTIKLEFPRGQF